MSSPFTPLPLSRVYLDLYPRLYPSNLEKKIPSSIFSALLILALDVCLSYLHAPSLCFLDGYLSYLDVPDIFIAFPEATKYQKKIPICSG